MAQDWKKYGLIKATIAPNMAMTEFSKPPSSVRAS